MNRKHCNKCGEEKPERGFNRIIRDGEFIHVGTCRECESKKHKERYMQNPDLYREISKKWREDNPDRLAAQNYLNNAIRKGYIIRPTHCPICHEIPPTGSVCGSFRGHWSDRQLQWACRACRKMLSSRGEEVPVHCVSLAPLPIPRRPRTEVCVES